MHRSTAIAALVAAAVSVAIGAAGAQAVGLVTSAQIRNGTITLQDMAPGAIRALKGQRGPEGPQGPVGVQGLPGTPGGFDPAHVSVVQGPAVTLSQFDADGVTTVEAICPAGTKATGGGYFSSIAVAAASAPYADGHGWFAIVTNFHIPAGIDVLNLQAFAVCAAP